MVWPWPPSAFAASRQSFQLQGELGLEFPLGGEIRKGFTVKCCAQGGLRGRIQAPLISTLVPVQSRCPPASLRESGEGRWCPLVWPRPHFLWNLERSAGPSAFQEGGIRWRKGGGCLGKPDPSRALRQRRRKEATRILSGKVNRALGFMTMLGR